VSLLPGARPELRRICLAPLTRATALRSYRAASPVLTGKAATTLMAYKARLPVAERKLRLNFLLPELRSVKGRI